VQKPVVEAEDRNHPVVRVDGGTQRRVIMHPQVTTKPDERGQGANVTGRPSIHDHA
jgi:hypothetical protein